MKINNYSLSHAGNQPIRVLQHNLLYAFEQSKAGFLELSASLVTSGTLHPGISYHISNGALNDPDGFGGNHKPYLKDGKVIHIHESYLSYLWSICYALITLYEEQVAKPSQNLKAGEIVFPIAKQSVHNANGLFAYARSLVLFFDEWPPQLPNPESYESSDAQWTEGINAVYTSATSFILLHEFAHALWQHGAQKRKLKADGASQAELQALSRKLEQEADDFAIDSMQKGHRMVDVYGRQVSTKVTSDVGALIGICALIFMGPSVAVSTTHPSLADRIDRLIQKTKPDPESQLWGVACVALKLWAIQFGHAIELPAELDSYEQLYHIMLDKARQFK